MQADTRFSYRRQQDASPVRASKEHAPAAHIGAWPFTPTNTSVLGFVTFALSLLGIAAFCLVLAFHFAASVWSLNSLGHDVLLLGGTGVVVTTDTTTNAITLDATGLLNDVAGPGITISTVNGTTAISHTISDGTALVESDPLGPQVQYGININAPNGTWRVTTTSAFPGTFIPGVVAGDDGQGNVGGTAWSVPATDAVYAFNAHCFVVPSAYLASDYMSASVALSFNATSADPTTGTIPAGGYSTLPLSVGSAGAGGPPLASAVSLSATVHACATCAVQAGAPLHLHGRLDHEGSSAAPSVAMTCKLQISRLV